MTLSDIPSRERVVLDTNILVYANQRQSDQCAQLLRRCARGDVEGIVPLPMAAELLHTLMLIEARENGWIERSNPTRHLSAHPELIRRLSNYEVQMREFLAIRLRIEPAQPSDLIEALSVQRELGLLTNDALLVAICRRLACYAIATADQAFANLRKFLIYTPDDLGQ